MTPFEQIKIAIASKHPVAFSYKGSPERIGNPYALFVQTNNKIKAHIVQTAGYTESQLNAFKPFNIEDISSVRIIEDVTFVPDHPYYKPESSYYSKVIVKV